MKKLVLFISLLICSINIFGQNIFNFTVRARGGIIVGLDGIKIDSITSSNDTLSFWHNGSEIHQKGSGSSMTYPSAGIPLSTGSAWGTSITNNSTNWNTAYTDRMKWDGGETGLTPSTGRTSLGATTVGSAFFTLSNPSLITFPRINADNTVTARLASELKIDLSLNNVTNESKTTMFTSPAFTGSVPTTGGIAMSRVFSDTMSVSAGVLRTKVTTLTTEPYSVQIFSSNGKDITHAVSDSVALNGGVYKLYVYSVDALSGCKIKILY